MGEAVQAEELAQTIVLTEDGIGLVPAICTLNRHSREQRSARCTVQGQKSATHQADREETAVKRSLRP